MRSAMISGSDLDPGRGGKNENLCFCRLSFPCFSISKVRMSR